jgi:hypothetical protein
MPEQMLEDSKAALWELLGTWLKAAINLAELQRAEWLRRRLARKSKLGAFKSAAAWTAGAGGTKRSSTLAERPMARTTKAAEELAEADDAGGANVAEDEDAWQQVWESDAMWQWHQACKVNI